MNTDECCNDEHIAATALVVTISTVSPAENQKGAIAAQRCFTENQNGLNQ